MLKTFKFHIVRKVAGVVEYMSGYSVDDEEVYWTSNVEHADEFEFKQYNQDWAHSWVRFLEYNGDQPFMMVPVA